METLREKNIRIAREALKRARALRQARRERGADGICHHIEGVDGDWLENWSDLDKVSVNPKVSDANLPV